MIWNYNIVIVDYDNLEKTERVKKKLLFWVFIFLSFHHSFFTIYIYNTSIVQSLTEGVSALIVVIGVIVLKYKRKIIIPTILLSFYSFLSISIGVWQNGGIYSSEIAWYIITIISITVALDRQIGIRFYTYTFLMVLLMGLFQYFEIYDFTKNLLSNGKNYALYSCISVFIIVGVIIRFIFSSENIDKIWKKEKEEKIELLEKERANQLIQDRLNSLNFMKQLLENTEIERKRIASDLHDSVSHELLNLKYVFTQDLDTVNIKIDRIIEDVRSISRNLHPVMFDKIGLVANVESLIERLQNQFDFMISTEINYHGTLNAAAELQVYRIIQEALTNIIKYAKAHAAKITMLESSEEIRLKIIDNGQGFNVKETLNSGKAFGLHNIIERSRVIGGEASIVSQSTGTIIDIRISKK